MTGVKLANLKLTASHAFRNTINDFMTKLFQVRQLPPITIRLPRNYHTHSMCISHCFRYMSDDHRY